MEEADPHIEEDIDLTTTITTTQVNRVHRQVEPKRKPHVKWEIKAPRAIERLRMNCSLKQIPSVEQTWVISHSMKKNRHFR